MTSCMQYGSKTYPLLSPVLPQLGDPFPDDIVLIGSASHCLLARVVVQSAVGGRELSTRQGVALDDASRFGSSLLGRLLCTERRKSRRRSLRRCVSDTFGDQARWRSMTYGSSVANTRTHGISESGGSVGAGKGSTLEPGGTDTLSGSASSDGGVLSDARNRRAALEPGGSARECGGGLSGAGERRALRSGGTIVAGDDVADSGGGGAASAGSALEARATRARSVVQVEGNTSLERWSNLGRCRKIRECPPKSFGTSLARVMSGYESQHMILGIRPGISSARLRSRHSKSKSLFGNSMGLDNGKFQ